MLDQLLAFCRVVEEESFTRAARVLHRSQPAVTKQVARLEQDLGMLLLDRKGRQVSPTASGRLVYTYAKRVSTTISDLEVLVRDMHTPGHGHVWVGSVTALSVYTLPPLLAAFTTRWPKVRLHVRTGQIQETVERVLTNDVDVGFVTVPVSHSGLIATPLFRDPVVLVASPALARDLPRPLPLSDLGHLPQVGYQAPSRFRSFVDAALEQAGVSPEVSLEFDSQEAVVTMVGLGFGAAFVPLSTVKAALASGALVALPVEGLADLARTTCLITPRDTPRPPATRAFLAMALDHLFSPDDDGTWTVGAHCPLPPSWPQAGERTGRANTR